MATTALNKFVLSGIRLPRYSPGRDAAMMGLDGISCWSLVTTYIHGFGISTAVPRDLFVQQQAFEYFRGICAVYGASLFSRDYRYGIRYLACYMGPRDNPVQSRGRP